jgi:hypothetical protein
VSDLAPFLNDWRHKLSGLISQYSGDTVILTIFAFQSSKLLKLVHVGLTETFK